MKAGALLMCAHALFVKLLDATVCFSGIPKHVSQIQSAESPEQNHLCLGMA